MPLSEAFMRPVRTKRGLHPAPRFRTIADMKEAVFYAASAVVSLFIAGYAAHMMVGGLVAPATERLVIAGVVLAAAAAIGWMAWDVARRKRR